MSFKEETLPPTNRLSSVDTIGIQQSDHLSNSTFDTYSSTDRIMVIGEELVRLSEEDTSVSHQEEFKLLLKLYGNHPEVKRAILKLRKKPYDPCSEDDSIKHMRKESKQYPVLERDEETRLFTDLRLSIDVLNRPISKDGLSPEDEKILINAAIAHNILLISNFRMVIAAAFRYIPTKSMSTEDIIQEGNIGLFNAIAKFDINKGASFYSYAQYPLRNYISRAYASQARPIKLPINVSEKISQLRNVTSSLEKNLGRKPTKREIEKESNLSFNKISKLQVIYNHQTLSFETNIDADKDLPLIDEEFDEYIDQTANSTIESFENKELIESLLSNPLAKLSDRQKTILKLRFGQDCTLDEIGKTMDLSKERIRQILASTFASLKRVYSDVERRNNNPVND